MKMFFFFNYCLLIVIVSINSVTCGFRAFVEKRLRPARARISFNAKSIRNRQEYLFAASASTPRKLLQLYNSPNEGDELNRDKLYFVKEKGSMSVEEAAVANNNILDEDIVSKEEKIPDDPNKDSLNLSALPDTDNNRLDWNMTKHALSKFANVSSCCKKRFYVIFRKSNSRKFFAFSI
jgi:hypothetical protein